jgi:signal transduction histidine kinase
VETPAAGRPDHAAFIIADTGIGIDPENLSKIFNPFFTTKENGTGLGLAIVRKFVESQGGTIAVAGAPAPQTGTSFTVLLPLAGQ